MRRFLFCAVLMICALGACDLPPTVDHIDVTWDGIYVVKSQEETNDPNTAAGFRHLSNGFKSVMRTHTIPAKIGLRFGFKFIVHGEPQGAEVALKRVDIFPEKGLKNPDKKETTYREEYETNRIIGDESSAGYVFDHDWEMVQGVWKFQLWDGDRKLAEESFTIVKP